MGHQVCIPYAGAGHKHQTLWGTVLTEITNWDLSAKFGVLRGIVFYNGELYISGNTDDVTVWNTSGVFQREWTVGTASDPRGVHEAGGEIYVAGSATDKIYVYNTSGSLQRSWSVGNNPNQLWVDSGEVYVALYDDDTIEVYNTAGALQRSWSTDTGPGALTIFNGEVYVTANGKIEVYSITGTLTRSWAEGLGGSVFSWLTNDGESIIIATEGAFPSIRVVGIKGELVTSGESNNLAVAFGDGITYGLREPSSILYSYKQPHNHQAPRITV